MKGVTIMKKILLSILMLLSIFTISGCASKEGKAFKEDYEKLNGQTNASGKVHRTISIDEDNPFIEVSADDIVKKIENKETFYVYFGSALCPWCRSTIESAIKVAKENNIKTIYYVDIWDENGKEVLRDKYELQDNELVKTIEGTESYYKLLDYFNDFLSDYTITDSDGNAISTNEKRIFAPNFMYIQDGEIKKLTNGKADSQTDSRQELTDELKNEQIQKYKEFFNN